MKPLCLAILAAFLFWWWFYPAPVRTPVEQPTGVELREIGRAVAKYGNCLIVLEEGRRVMHTSYGKVRL